MIVTLKDVVVNRVYSAKNGDLVLGIKCKPGDFNIEQEHLLRALWRDGTPIDKVDFTILVE